MLYGKEVKIFEDTYTLKKSTINSCENNSLYIISEAQINQISDICHTKTLSSQEMAEEITNILNNAISE